MAGVERNDDEPVGDRRLGDGWFWYALAAGGLLILMVGAAALYFARLNMRLSREVADSCLQYWGGMGFTADNPIAQSYRDGRLISIGGGADEIMLGIICKLEGTLPGKA